MTRSEHPCFPEMMAVVLEQRITFCYVLFTALIVLNILAALDAIAPLLSKESEEWTAVGNKTEADVGGQEWLSTDTVEESVEVLALVVLYTLVVHSNMIALLGLQRTEPDLLVPWIFVYLSAICSSYIEATILFVSEVNEGKTLNTEIVYPLGTALAFHLALILVESVFDELKGGQIDA